MCNVLINTSNLHVGGGVQAATSFLCELADMPDQARQMHVLASTVIHKNLKSVGCRTEVFASYKVMDVYGFSLFKTPAHRLMDKFDIVFTVFGPLYRWSPPFKSIVGFAQGWILYPNSRAWSFLPQINRIKSRLKFWIHTKYFQRADRIIVELEHAKTKLNKVSKTPKDKINIVHNCLATLYQTPEVWQAVNIPEVDCDVKLGFLGRNYPHKNIAMFANVAKILELDHDIKARLFVTFTDDEWAACSDELRSVCINVGPLTVAQCPNFYKHIEVVFFPSILECFSATPLEAMAMEKNLFVSDMPFNRDICSEFATYFDAFSPQEAAQVVADFLNEEKHSVDLNAARNHAFTFSTPRQRAESYLALLKGA